jgi:hypothetical protein
LVDGFVRPTAEVRRDALGPTLKLALMKKPKTWRAVGDDGRGLVNL